MPTIIEHRRNWLAGLQNVNPEHGVEIDLRSDVCRPNSLHLSHDPWTRGDDFEMWLQAFCARKIRGPLILNTKEDNLEPRIEALLAQHNIDNYFFLDSAPATLVRRCLAGLGGHMSARLSAYEPAASLAVYTPLEPAHRPRWLWVDCFEAKPVAAAELSALRAHYNICLVSPELHGFAPKLCPGFLALGAIADAVCTKVPEIWQR